MSLRLVAIRCRCLVKVPQQLMAFRQMVQLQQQQRSLICPSVISMAKAGKKGTKHKTHMLSEQDLDDYCDYEAMTAEISNAMEHLSQTYATQLALRSNLCKFNDFD